MRIKTRPLPGHKIIASMSWVCSALVSHFFSFLVERVCFTSLCLRAGSHVCICTYVVGCMWVGMCIHPLVGVLFFPAKTKKSPPSPSSCACVLPERPACVPVWVSFVLTPIFSFPCRSAYSNTRITFKIKIFGLFWMVFNKKLYKLKIIKR